MIRRDDDFATQFKLVLYAAVRMKLKILAARTFEKVYEALVGGCLSDGVVNALEKQALDSFRLDHNISDQMHERIVERCGWTLREYKQGAKMDRLEGEISVGSTSNYDGLLDGIVADGIINAIERKALDMRRADHKINDKYHAQALARFGWTVEDYERGFKLPAAEVQVADNNVQSSDADKQK